MIVGLAVVAGIGVWIWKPWVPPVEITGPGGRRVTDDGLLAKFYPGTGAGRRPAVLVIGASEGGIGKAVDTEAQALAEAGLAVLAVSYFRSPGQPHALEDIPLEGFAKAIDWLARQPEVDPARIGIVGGSKGAEAALLVASRDRRIRAVAAGMPSSVIQGGFDWDDFSSNSSSWVAGGKPLPFLPFARYDWRKGGSTDQIYIAGLANLARHPNAIIAAERIAGPILLLCGEKDSLWPLCLMARQVEARILAKGEPPVTLLAYPDAGRGVLGCREPATSRDLAAWAAATPATRRRASLAGPNLSPSCGKASPRQPCPPPLQRRYDRHYCFPNRAVRHVRMVFLSVLQGPGKPVQARAAVSAR